VRLVYQEAFRSVGKALAREYVVKQLTRAQKEALVVGARRRHH
jgi:predicted GIY-YIG superfamily endonuclease